ncbi:UNVERIFIED_CONTAM: hypothetical protein PYX00_001530 [Menopon gallinae]|uniref:Autophagy-related protein 13 n=1 Tax=Menopon gallinae TaxID=328185 RepID=A0AAW2IED0_9NEOP
MASGKLNAQEKKDLDKFTKFLSLKAAQIIVQSRLGEKVQMQCKPHSPGADWFNLAVRDLPEVLAEAKKALCGEVITPRSPLCVEISLRTVEGDTMMLETWSLGVLPEHSDPSVRVTYTVYNRMGILLKSLVSVTRITPAYKLSRRQSPDSYVMCYRIYMGEPQLHSLGEGYKQVRVGQLCTPIGTIHITVSYRTKMTFSPQSTGRDNSIMLKSDHFRPDFSPKHFVSQSNEDLNVSMSETMKVGAFANRQEVLDDLIMPDAPFSSLLIPRQQSPPENNNIQVNSSETGQNNASTKGSNSDTESEADGNGNITPRQPSSRADSRRSSCSLTSNADDFIMVDLKTPFANTNANTDLGTFYRECQTAPPLQTFDEQPTLGETVNDLTKQLQDFELSVPKYEQLLSRLCNAENNN